MGTAAERPVVLVVDDTPLNLTLLEKTLGADYTVRLAGSAQEALDYAFATPPDLILLDVMMPGMDGFEACRRLKANPETSNVPVIFVTAKNEVKDEELGFSLGASDFIHKPISPPVVAARVRTHLKVKFMQEYLMRENVRLQEHADQHSSDLEQLKGLLWGNKFARG